MVHQRREFTIIKPLKQAIATEWGKLSQRLVDRTIDHWSPASVRRPAARRTQLF